MTSMTTSWVWYNNKLNIKIDMRENVTQSVHTDFVGLHSDSDFD